MRRLCSVSGLLSYTPYQAVAVAVLYVTTFTVVLPWYCSDWIYSLYFRGHPNDLNFVERAMALNEERLIQANDYFDALSPDTSVHIKNSGDGGASMKELGGMKREQELDLSIVMISTERQIGEYTPRYWLQTMAELHKQYRQDTHFPRKRLILCNVNREENHVSRLADVIDLVSRFTGQEDDPEDKEDKSDYTKAKDDYAFCLQLALSNRSRYVLVLEDDALIKPVFFQQLYRHLHTNLAIRAERGAEGDQWAFIKLYYPEKWLGYSWEWHHVSELLGIMMCTGFTAAACACCLFLLNTARGVTTQRSHLHSSITHCFLFTAVYCVCVCVCVGRAYIVELLPARLLHAKECCVPTVLYRASVLPDLAHYLSSTEIRDNQPHDLMIDWWAEERRYDTYLTQPNMITHIGLVSTVNERTKFGAEFMFG